MEWRAGGRLIPILPSWLLPAFKICADGFAAGRPTAVAPPPGAEEDEAADAEVEALLPAGARPCTCGRCQREQQQPPPAAAAPAPSSEEAGSAGAGEACGEAGAAGSTAASLVCPPPGEAAGPPDAAYGGAEPCQADGVAGSSSPSRVQLAQQQWREAMHSEVRRQGAPAAGSLSWLV